MAIAGEHDLLSCFVQGIEGMKELLLRLLFSLEELNVVDKKNVVVPVAAFETFDRIVTKRVDEIIREHFDGDEAYRKLGSVAAHVVTDGLQKMSLAEANASVDEERVIRCAGRFGRRKGSGMGEAVGRAYDKTLKRVLAIEAGGRGGCFWLGRRLCLRRRLSPLCRDAG